MWKIIHPGQGVKAVFEDRVKRQEMRQPLQFLCITVDHSDTGPHRLSQLDYLIAWVRKYQETEKAGIQRLIGARSPETTVPLLLPASILVLIDPLPYLAEDTWEEYHRRETLAEIGVILLERDAEHYPASCEGDQKQLEDVVHSMPLLSQPPDEVPTFDPVQVLAHAENWQPTSLPATAAPFGRQPAHTELPDNETLKKILKTYIETDWRELDY